MPENDNKKLSDKEIEESRRMVLDLIGEKDSKKPRADEKPVVQIKEKLFSKLSPEEKEESREKKKEATKPEEPRVEASPPKAEVKPEEEKSVVIPKKDKQVLKQEIKKPRVKKPPAKKSFSKRVKKMKPRKLMKLGPREIVPPKHISRATKIIIFVICFFAILAFFFYFLALPLIGY